MSGNAGLIKIFEYALNQEKTGMSFFETSLGRLGVGAAVGAFRRLIAEEQQHIAFLDGILATLRGGGEIEMSALKDVPLESANYFDERDREAAQAAATQLVALGVDIAVITLGEYGVVYADEETKGHIPALQTQIVDPTGAGDAMTAAIIFGLLEDIPLDECVRLGVTAAALTLRSRETVRPDLSIDLLYDELVI